MKKFLKSNLLLSIGITVISMLICYILFGFKMFYGTNDDYGISSVLKYGGVSDSIFISYFIAAPLAFLQKIFPTINLFIIFQLIINLFSFVLINYVILEKFAKKYALLFILIINILFLSTSFVFIQWTQTTALGCIAGYLSIFSAFTFYKKSKYKYVLAGFGLLLTIFSSLIRIAAFYSVSAVFAVFVLSYLIVYYWKNKIENNITLKKVIKKQLLLIVSLFITAVLVFGINLLSDILKSNTYGYNSFESYNEARAGCIDYAIAPFEGEEEFYNSKGILSQTDLDLFKDWIIDEDLFTEETLLSIQDYSKVNTVEYILNLIINKLDNMLNINPYIVLAGLGVLAILAVLALFIFRNKLKYLFPALLVSIYLLYFIVFKFSVVYILALPVLGLIIATAYLFNRYHYFYLLCISGITLLLVLYLNFTRINFRSTFTIFITAILCLIMCIDKNNIRNKIHKQTKTVVKRILLCFSVIFIIGTVVYSEYIVLTSEEFIKNPSSTVDENLYNYIESNNDELFVVLRKGNSSISKYYNSPLLAPEKPNNVLSQSGWLGGSSLNEQKKAEYNIDKVFKDMINNESASFVVEMDMSENLERYYNDHYADEDESISLVEQEKFGDVCIYKVVSQ